VELRAQALNTVSTESTRGWRISKEKASQKIDAIVALAMGCVSALDQGNVQAIDIPPHEIEAIQAQAAQEAAQAADQRGTVTTGRWEDLIHA
jgi:hypothetical protein